MELCGKTASPSGKTHSAAPFRPGAHGRSFPRDSLPPELSGSGGKEWKRADENGVDFHLQKIQAYTASRKSLDMTDSTGSGEALCRGRLREAASQDATEQPAPAHRSLNAGIPVPGQSLPGTAGHELLQTRRGDLKQGPESVFRIFTGFRLGQTWMGAVKVRIYQVAGL